MNEKTKYFYSFGPFQLDAGECLLMLDGKVVPLPPKAFEALLMLVGNAGHLVEKDDLMRRLWPDTFVEEGNVAKHVSLLRKILSEATNGREYIETIPKRGYRFVVEVEVADAEAGSHPQGISAATLIGKKVSHYRVLEVLGGGGMGLVYKAEDLKLGRRVALKFLTDEVAADSLSLQRFEREARTASSLNHPNICTIYGIEEHEGQPFIVMEYLEGQSLRDRLAAFTPGEKALSLERLLDVATQVIRGLEAAHEKGIIHRDIKPANIFITHRGEVKILDFGVAKLTHMDDRGGIDHQEKLRGLVRDPTLTRTGVALGTASYMSPEQVRGEKLDTRTDLFSFGLVLYEMATGQRAFAGETVAEIHEAILDRNAVPVRQLDRDLPPQLEEIVSKALEKDRDVRYQHASEIHADLSRLIPEAPTLSRRWQLIVVGVFALGVITFAIFGFTNRRASSSLPELKLTQLTSNSSENPVRSGAISPDGRYLAYADQRGIHVKALETGDTQTIQQPDVVKEGTLDWQIVQWFPDGTRFLANLSPPPERHSPELNSSIWTVSMLGGAPQKIRDGVNASSISPDGSVIVFGTNPGKYGDREIWLMRPDGEQARKLFESGESKSMSGTQWTSNGRRLGYLTINASEIAIESRPLGGGPPVKVLPNAGDRLMDFFWLPDGRMIYSLIEWTSNEYACNYSEIRIDDVTGEVVEKPKRITNWTGFCMSGESVTADNKRLAFLEWAPQFSVYVANLGGNGTRISDIRRLTLTRNKTYPSAWTADNKAVIFNNRVGNERWGIYKQSLNQDTAERVIASLPGDSVYLDPKDVPLPRTSPDGDWILYTVKEKQKSSSAATKLMRVRVSGGPAELVMTGNFDGPPSCTSAPANLCAFAERTEDLKQLVFTSFDPRNGRGSELTRSGIEPDADYAWALSPDGTRIALLRRNVEGPIRIIGFSKRAPHELRVKGWPSFDSVAWAADGRGLFVSSHVDRGSVLVHVDLGGNSQVLWKKDGSPGTYAIPSPDGRHLAISDWILDGNIWMMENF